LFKKTLNEVCGKFSLVLEKAVQEGLITIGGQKEKPKSLLKGGDNIDMNASAKSSEMDTSTSAKGKENMNQNPSGKNGAAAMNKDGSKKALNNNINNDVGTSLNGKPVNQSIDSALMNPSPIPVVFPLDEEDIQFLIDRFEISDYVHYGHFVQLFNDTFDRWQRYSKKYVSIPDDLISSNPFRLNSEWNSLKQSSILRKSYQDTIERSEASIKKSNKSFNAPKKVPEKKIEEKKPEQKEEKEPEDPKNKIPETVAEPKKKEEIEKELTDQKKTAPVVEQSGCFGCGGGGAKKTQNQPLEIADAKKPAEEKKGDKDRDRDNDLKIETDSIADGKEDDSIKLKRDESFETPKNIKRRPAPKFDALDEDDNRNKGKLPDRDVLGNADMGEKRKVVIASNAQSSGRGGRFRRRADRDFDQEKPELDDDSDDMDISDANIVRTVKK
jgi:hypothetical protein